MTKKHAKKTPKKNKKMKLVLSAIGAVAVATYIGFGMKYQTHYLPGTTAYGVKIGNLNKEDATKKLKNDLENAVFTLNDKDKKIASVTGSKLGIQQDFGPFLTEKLDSQNPWLFQKGDVVKGNSKTNVTAFNDEAVNDFVNGLFPTINDGRTKTKDAQVINKDGEFEVVPEVNGNEFSAKSLRTVVSNAIQTGQKEIELSKNYVKPEVTKDSKTLKNLLGDLKKLSEVKGTYELAGKEVSIPSKEISSWLETKGNEVAFNKDKIQTFLANLNEKYATYGSTRQFKSTARGVVPVGGGIYGWSINPDEEIPKLTDIIKQGQDFTREPTIQGSGYHKDGTDIGSSYVEVDKVAQHMYVYQDGKQIISTDIVTGKPGQDTPVGIFNVWSKERNATLRGFNDDGSRYASPVSFWMPIDNTGVGLHDSPWQPKYGGDWYQQHGSHGCVNTPPNVMTKLFDAVPVGTPVIVI